METCEGGLSRITEYQVQVIIITGYEAGDCIGGFERGHSGYRQVVYAWVESHFGLNFVALAGYRLERHGFSYSKGIPTLEIK